MIYSNHSSLPPALEPMQIDSYHLSQSERQQRINNNLFLYCGAEGHLISNCPICPAFPAMSTIQLPPIISSLTKTIVSVTTTRCYTTAQALIDSGSGGNFIQRELLQHLHLKEIPCQKDLNIHKIQGKPVGRRVITHYTPTLTLKVGILHQEQISFLVL